nr:secretoglobin family 2B member 2-like [Meriones unguiculatus]
MLEEDMLGARRAEACIPFLELMVATVSGNRHFLDLSTAKFNATAEEVTAFRNIQDCYNDGGLWRKALEPNVMKSLYFSKECVAFYGTETVKVILEFFQKMMAHSKLGSS